jgi:hypothetical protein
MSELVSIARRPPSARAARSTTLSLGRQVRGQIAERRCDAAGEDDPEPERSDASRAPARGREVCGRRDALRDVGDEDSGQEAQADRKPVPTWIPKMTDSGTPSTTEPTTMPIAPPLPLCRSASPPPGRRPGRRPHRSASRRRTASPRARLRPPRRGRRRPPRSARRRRSRPERRRGGRARRASRQGGLRTAGTTRRASPGRMPQAPVASRGDTRLTALAERSSVRLLHFRPRA